MLSADRRPCVGRADAPLMLRRASTLDAGDARDAALRVGLAAGRLQCSPVPSIASASISTTTMQASCAVKPLSAKCVANAATRSGMSGSSSNCMSGLILVEFLNGFRAARLPSEAHLLICLCHPQVKLRTIRLFNFNVRLGFWVQARNNNFPFWRRCRQGCYFSRDIHASVS